MRIGVDIDGVLNNISEWHLSYGAKFCSDHHINRGIEPSQYFVKDVFSLTEQERDRFWKQYMYDLIVDIPPRPHTAEYIHKIRQLGHQIVILSARNDDFLDLEDKGKQDDYIISWLVKNDIEYDELISSSINKTQTCIEASIDLMIEDKAVNVLSISKSIPVLCFDQLHNREVAGTNIIRVYSWAEVYEYIVKNTEEEII